MKAYYRYITAVKAILKAQGTMSDEEFAKHVIVCCKEAEELNLSLSEEINEINSLIDELKAICKEKKLELAKSRFPFKNGDIVLVQNLIGPEQKGIFEGFESFYGDIVPSVRAISKNGNPLKRKIFTSPSSIIVKV